MGRSSRQIAAPQANIMHWSTFVNPLTRQLKCWHLVDYCWAHDGILQLNAAFVYGDDGPFDPGLTLWLTKGVPRLSRHVLKHVSTSLLRDRCASNYILSIVAAIHGLIPRLDARLHASESGSDRQLRLRSSSHFQY